MNNTHPELRRDVNGKMVTRHVSNGVKVQNGRVASIGVPPIEKEEDPFLAVLGRTPLKEMDSALLGAAIQHKFTSQRVQDAIALASFLHRNATRGSRGPQPREAYINHPLRNTVRLIRLGLNDEDIAIANIFHDVIEDASPELIEIYQPSRAQELSTKQEQMDFATFEIIKPVYGERVSNIVYAVSNPELPKGIERSESWKLYRKHVLDEISSSEDGVVLTKASDLQDNAGSLHHHFNERRDMVLNMAQKYQPLFQPVIQRLEKVKSLSENGIKLLVIQMQETEKRLIEFKSLN